MRIVTLCNPEGFPFTWYGSVWDKVGAIDEPWFSCIGVPNGGVMLL